MILILVQIAGPCNVLDRRIIDEEDDDDLDTELQTDLVAGAVPVKDLQLSLLIERLLDLCPIPTDVLKGKVTRWKLKRFQCTFDY